MDASGTASDTASASADFGSSGISSVRELSPRGDDITPGASSPGCVLPFFKPVYTVDTNPTPTPTPTLAPTTG